MPRKAKTPSAEATSTTKRKRRSSDHGEDNEGEGKTRTKRGGALSKFEEFDVSEVLQKCPDPPVEEEAPLASAPAPEPVPEPEPEPEPEVRLEPETLPILLPPSPPPPIPQLFPPEPLRDLPEDEEFVPLPAIQVIPSMNRAAEAQNGLLKEPAPPSNIQRVTQPGMLAPAMPTALMQLLSG